MATFIAEDTTMLAQQELYGERDALGSLVMHLRTAWENDRESNDLREPGMIAGLPNVLSDSAVIQSAIEGHNNRVFLSDALTMKTPGALKLVNEVIVSVGRIGDFYTRQGFGDPDNISAEVKGFFDFIIDEGAHKAQLEDIYTDGNAHMEGNYIIDPNGTFEAIKYLERHRPSLIKQITSDSVE